MCHGEFSSELLETEHRGIAIYELLNKRTNETCWKTLGQNEENLF